MPREFLQGMFGRAFLGGLTDQATIRKANEKIR